MEHKALILTCTKSTSLWLDVLKKEKWDTTMIWYPVSMSKTSTYRKLHNVTVFVAGHFEAGEIGHNNNLVFVWGPHQPWQLPVVWDRQVHPCVLVVQLSEKNSEPCHIEHKHCDSHVSTVPCTKWQTGLPVCPCSAALWKNIKKAL